MRGPVRAERGYNAAVPMTRAREESRWTLVAFMLLASLLVHLVLWPVGDELVSLGWNSPPLPRTDGWMQIALVDPEPEEPPPPAPPEEPRKRRETDPPGELIKQDRVAKEAVPDDTKYISEFDQSVDKETRAPRQRARPGGLPMNPGDAPDADNLPRTQPQPTPAAPTPVPSKGPSELGEGDQREGAMADPAEVGALPLAPGRTSPSGRPGLRGTPGAMARALGQPGSFDKIDDDIAESSETMLNSRRWKYASFFNRVRDAVAERWRPEEIHAARDPNGAKFGTIPRVTRLFIKLNPDGSVNKISVEDPCGLDFLDEEAIRAVRAAQPFNNPPPQLVDPESGLIEFGFGFRLEFSKGGGRIFRYTH
jgi:TonB family protein